MFRRTAENATPRKPEERSDSSGRDVLIGILCVLPLWTVLTLSALRYEMDDALIYFRYARNFVLHGELTYHLGHRWNGLTSPLFTCVSLFFALVTRKVIPAVNLFCGASLLAAAGGLQYVIARATGRRLAGFLAIGLVTASPFFYCCFGLETHLVLLLIILAVAAFMKERHTLLAWILGLLLATRIDSGLFLLAAVLWELTRRHGLKGLKSRLNLAVPVLAPLVLASVLKNLYYDNSSLHTLTAKLGQGLSGYWGPWPRAFLDVRRHGGLFWGGYPWLFLPVAALAVTGALEMRGRLAHRLILGYLLLHGGVFALLNAPYYHWYYAPFYYFGLGYAAAGLSGILARCRSLREPARRQLALGLSGVLAALILVSSAVLAYRTVSRLGPAVEYRSTASFIEGHCPPEAIVAAAEIGAIGWYCPDRTMVDILGLVTEGNAEALARRDVRSWLTRNQPDCIVIHDPPWAFEQVAVEAESLGLYEDFPGYAVEGLRLLRRVERDSGSIPPEGPGASS